MKEINSITPTNIDGDYYWTINQFAQLTGKTEGSIRMLLSRGNKIRKLCVKHFHNKPYIPYNELFDFHFVEKGRPTELGIYVSKCFCLTENNKLVCKDVKQYPDPTEDEDISDDNEDSVPECLEAPGFNDNLTLEEEIDLEIEQELLGLD